MARFCWFCCVDNSSSHFRRLVRSGSTSARCDLLRRRIGEISAFKSICPNRNCFFIQSAFGKCRLFRSSFFSFFFVGSDPVGYDDLQNHYMPLQVLLELFQFSQNLRSPPCHPKKPFTLITLCETILLRDHLTPVLMVIIP